MRLQSSISPELEKRLVTFSDKTGLTIGEIVRAAIHEYLLRRNA